MVGCTSIWIKILVKSLEINRIIADVCKNCLVDENALQTCHVWMTGGFADHVQKLALTVHLFFVGDDGFLKNTKYFFSGGSQSLVDERPQVVEFGRGCLRHRHGKRDCCFAEARGVEMANVLAWVCLTSGGCCPAWFRWCTCSNNWFHFFCFSLIVALTLVELIHIWGRDTLFISMRHATFFR